MNIIQVLIDFKSHTTKTGGGHTKTYEHHIGTFEKIIKVHMESNNTYDNNIDTNKNRTNTYGHHIHTYENHAKNQKVINTYDNHTNKHIHTTNLIHKHMKSINKRMIKSKHKRHIIHMHLNIKQTHNICTS